MVNLKRKLRKEYFEKLDELKEDNTMSNSGSLTNCRMVNKKEWDVDPDKRKKMVVFLIGKGYDAKKIKKLSGDALQTTYDIAKRSKEAYKNRLESLKESYNESFREVDTDEVIANEVKRKLSNLGFQRDTKVKQLTKIRKKELADYLYGLLN